MKLIIILTILINLFNYNITKLDTPQKISNFMIANIRYSLDLEELLKCDYLQTVEQTLTWKTGDCDDMAALTNRLLKNAGYESNIYIVNFSNRETAHAIVVFKQQKYYSIFSNQYLINTKETSIINAIKSEYKDVKNIYKIIKLSYGKSPRYWAIRIK